MNRTSAPALAAATSDWLRYNGPRGSIDTRSYYQALSPGLLPPGFFKDKLVLVGRSLRTATELNASQADMFNSPFAWLDGSDRLMPGVELHAHLLANRLLGNGLVSASPWWALGAGGLFSLLLAAFAQRMHPGLVAVGTATVRKEAWARFRWFEWDMVRNALRVLPRLAAAPYSA